MIYYEPFKPAKPEPSPDPVVLDAVSGMEFRKIPDTYFTDEEYLRIMRRGFEAGDQMFTTDKGGTYNASLFLRLSESFPEHFEWGTGKITDDLFEYIVKNIEIDPLHMASLTEEDLIKPVAVVTLNDPEPFHMIDGHHRVVRLYMEGFRQFYMVVGDRLMTHRCFVAAPRNQGH